MNAEVRGEVDLKGIYIKEEVRSEKIPARYPTKTSAVRFTSRRRTWGTRSRKNLIRARLECQSVRSVGCKEHRATTMASKSSFLLEDLERRILRGYYRGIRPQSPLFMYKMDLRPKPKTKGVRGGVNAVKRAHVGKHGSQFRS